MSEDNEEQEHARNIEDPESNGEQEHASNIDELESNEEQERERNTDKPEGNKDRDRERIVDDQNVKQLDAISEIRNWVIVSNIAHNTLN